MIVAYYDTISISLLQFGLKLLIAGIRCLIGIGRNLLALWPGLCLTIVVYSFNMFGDAMRDLLDPRLRDGEGSYGTAGKRKRGFLARLINPFKW